MMSSAVGSLWVVKYKITLWVDEDLSSIEIAKNVMNTSVMNHMDLQPGVFLIILEAKVGGEPVVLESNSGKRGRIAPGRFVHLSTNNDFGALQRLT